MQLNSSHIYLGLESCTQAQALELASNYLTQANFATPLYLQGLKDREAQHTTYLGNGFAIPHGTPQSRDQVIKSGMVVLQFPQGIDWDGQLVKILVVLAVADQQHLQVLQQLAKLIDNSEIADQFATTNQAQFIIDHLNNDSPILKASLIQLGLDSLNSQALHLYNCQALLKDQAIDQAYLTAETTPVVVNPHFTIYETNQGTLKNAIAVAATQQQLVVSVASYNSQISSYLVALLGLADKLQPANLTSEQLISLVTAQLNGETTPAVEATTDQAAALTASYQIINKAGLHMRPLGQLVKLIKSYKVKVLVRNLTTNSAQVSGSSLLKMQTIAGQQGHQLEFVVSGADADAALLAIGDLFNQGFGEE